MALNICIIDDKFGTPCVEQAIDPKKQISNSDLQKLLESQAWDDEVLHELTDSFLACSDFEISAYCNPSLFLRDTIISDIVIFDWDYDTATSSDNVESLLLEILKRKYCYVHIFTHCSAEDIEIVLKKDAFKIYKNRVSYNGKTAPSIETIKNSIADLENNNFSFRFRNIIRTASKEAIEDILIELGNQSLETVLAILYKTGESSRELIEFVGERFKNFLLRTDFSFPEPPYVEEEAQPFVGSTENEDHSIQELWKSRLYYSDKDDKVVRKGDILRINNNYYFVITPDCQLNRFWKKNVGYLNIIQLLDVNVDKGKIKELYAKIYSKKTIENSLGKVTSISNPLSIGGSPLCFPYVGNDNKVFLLFPVMLSSIQIPKPDWFGDNTKINSETALKVEMIPDSEKIVTLNEPFCSSVIETVFSELQGKGTSDFSPDIKTELQGILKKVTE